ncbi:MAG: hypothetical protein V4739_04680 [Pseudomonadota bacterium]
MTHQPSFELPRNILIGLSGPAGSGKDTCAEILHHQAGFETWAFAHPLRIEVKNAFCIELDMLSRRELKEVPTAALAINRCADPAFINRMHWQDEDPTVPRSPRWIMQQWGTNYRRADDPAYWVKQTLAAVKTMRSLGRHRIVVTDVRFSNEAYTIKALGGLMMRVQRGPLDTLAGETAAHVSEAWTPPSGTAVVQNTGDIAQLQQEVPRVLIEALKAAPRLVEDGVVATERRESSL